MHGSQGFQGPADTMTKAKWAISSSVNHSIFVQYAVSLFLVKFWITYPYSSSILYKLSCINANNEIKTSAPSIPRFWQGYLKESIPAAPSWGFLETILNMEVFPVPYLPDRQTLKMATEECCLWYSRSNWMKSMSKSINLDEEMISFSFK